MYRGFVRHIGILSHATSCTFFMNIFIRAISLILVAGFIFVPNASAATLEYSGWIPYWKAKAGADDARKHIKVLAEVNPFTYTVKSNGTINDAGNMSASHWKKLRSSAASNDVRYVPTIMWSDGAAIDRVLRDAELRKAHIEAIVELVDEHDYDGIDIDYEGKKAETKEYFSLFLAELNNALEEDDKWLSCTIEARMPVADRFTSTPPATAYQFANDLPSIGKACDTVRVMTYDQQTADQKLNATAIGPYFPNADTRWVRKVINQMSKDISKDKLVIGVATYGRELDVTVSPTGKFSYKNLWSFNPGYGSQIEKKFKVKKSRNEAGEQSITYIENKRSKPSQKTLVSYAPAGTPSGMQVALGAKEYARQTGESVTFRMLWWSDAGAMKEKVALAKELGVRGVAVFKFDGSEDKGIWTHLK